MALLQVVVGGQFGSEGKGAIAAFLAKGRSDLLAVRIGGPNAGHTVIGRCPPSCEERQTHDDIGAHSDDAHPWRLRHVPVAAVTSPSARLMLAAGSEVDPIVLVDEVESLDSAGYDVSRRIKVHHQATVIEAHHHRIESGDHNVAPSLVERIGSTGKGVGAARASRLMRNAQLASAYPELGSYLLRPGEPGPQESLADGTDVLIEGTQGYGLGLHAGFYPFCTSSDCTAVDFLSQAGISPWVSAVPLEVWVVFRPYPIRVAGNSGPMRGETTWEALGLDTELTTVTRRPRRVGGWDPDLARAALQANGAPSPRVKVALTMVDHVIESIHGVATLDSHAPNMPDLDAFLALIESDIGHPVDLIGTSASTVATPRPAARTPRPKAVSK